MTNDSEKKIVQQEINNEPEASAGESSSSKPMLLLAVCLLVLFVGFAYFAKNKLDVLVKHEHSELESLSSQLHDLRKNVNELQGQQAGLVSSIDTLLGVQSGLKKNIASLYQGQNNSNQEWALAEVEYLLLIASHRLMLESDVSTALAAMQAADKRLAGLPDPGLLSVRKQLTTDINSLQSLPKVDIAGLAMYLADLSGRVEELPLAEVEIKQSPEAGDDDAVDVTTLPWWKNLFISVWQELKGVIVISHENEQTELSLLPQQIYFLRQNLRLQLESTRYSVLRRDTDSFHSALDIAEKWLMSYFDTSNSAVANILESLSQMRGLELNPALPDISSSLETVRAYVKTSAPNNIENEKADGQ